MKSIYLSSNPLTNFEIIAASKHRRTVNVSILSEHRILRGHANCCTDLSKFGCAS